MQIDEEDTVAQGLGDGLGDAVTNRAAEGAETIESLGCRENGAGVGEGWLLQSQERFVAEDALAGRRNDGLVRHPERFESALEGGLEAGAVARDLRFVSEELQRLALGLRQSPESNRTADQGDEIGGLEGLGDVPHGAVLDGVDRRVERGIACHQDDRDVEIPLADSAEELNPVEPRHLNVAHDGVELAMRKSLDGGAAVRSHGDVEARPLEHATQRFGHGGVVVHDEHRPMRRRLLPRKGFSLAVRRYRQHRHSSRSFRAFPHDHDNPTKGTALFGQKKSNDENRTFRGIGLSRPLFRPPPSIAPPVRSWAGACASCVGTQGMRSFERRSPGESASRERPVPPIGA